MFAFWGAQPERFGTVLRMRHIGRYELGPEIARGGMGVVYRARDPQLGREVAIKLVLTSLSGEELRRFLLEGEAAARVRHPNVLPVHELSVHEGRPYLVMDLALGGSLRDRLRREGALGASEALQVLLPLCRALSALHQAQILHRDLKPENVLLAEDGTPLLADLGLAKALDKETRYTATGVPLGTPAYMSPEQALGNKSSVDVRSDVYGLGAILYELLSGSPPLRAESLLALLDSVVNTPPASLRTHVPGIDPALDAICLRCLEKDPQRRYASVAELATALERWEEPQVARRSHRALSGLALASLALIGAATAWAWERTVPLAPPAAHARAPATLAVTQLGPTSREGLARLRIEIGGSEARAVEVGPVGGEATGTWLAPVSGLLEFDYPCRRVGRTELRVRVKDSSLSARLVIGCPDLPRWFLALEERPPLLADLQPEPGSPQAYRNREDGSLLCWIPPGEALVQVAGALHRVPVAGFYLGKFEVSEAQLALYQAACGRESEPPKAGAVPAHWVDFHTASEYARSVGGRLPTVAEWNLAAYGRASAPERAQAWAEPGFDRVFADLDASSQGRGYPREVDQREATPEGVHGLAGGVREWVADLSPQTSSNLRANPWTPSAPLEEPGPRALRHEGRRGRTRETRGGSFQSPALDALPLGFTQYPAVVPPRNDLGFRIVRSPLYPEPKPLTWRVRFFTYPDSESFHREGAPGPRVEDFDHFPRGASPRSVTCFDLRDPWQLRQAPSNLPADGFALRAACRTQLPAGRWVATVLDGDDGYWLRAKQGGLLLGEAKSWTWQVVCDQELVLELLQPSEVSFEVDYFQLKGGKGLWISLARE